MPEEAEIPTEKLHEAIHEEMEKQGGSFLKQIALTTAILAAFAAISALRAGDTVNEALVLKTESTRLQAQASDEWALYQAKGIKGAVQRAAETSWLAIGKEAPQGYEQAAKRYAAEQDSIKHVAQEFEKLRDERSHEADGLLEHHHAFAQAVALFQVAIALGAVAALTRQRLMWWISILSGVAGLALFVKAFLA